MHPWFFLESGCFWIPYMKESSMCSQLECQNRPWVQLTHWGRMTYICVSNLPTIGSDNGWQPKQRQAIIWTNAGILLVGPSETDFSEIVIENVFKKMRLKMSSGKWQQFCVGLNVLRKDAKDHVIAFKGITLASAKTLDVRFHDTLTLHCSGNLTVISTQPY